MAYTLKALNELKEELNRTNVISQDFKATIMSFALDVANEAREMERKSLQERTRTPPIGGGQITQCTSCGCFFDEVPSKSLPCDCRCHT